MFDYSIDVNNGGAKEDQPTVSITDILRGETTGGLKSFDRNSEKQKKELVIQNIL